MEAKHTDLKNHTKGINAVLIAACGASHASPLVGENDLVITMCDSAPLSRRVTTDLGAIEFALRVPVPGAGQSRFWIALHETWKAKSKHIVRFHDCGLRLYVGGEDEEAVQILRLEWVAPTFDPSNPGGGPIFQGKHAGHPHWHIDRSALVGPDDYLASLEKLTLPEPQSELEDFSQAAAAPTQNPVRDCSWLTEMHLPAQAAWMDAEWDGQTIPGPHQSEPASVAALGRWWAGALRYLVAELPKVAPSM